MKRTGPTQAWGSRKPVKQAGRREAKKGKKGVGQAKREGGKEGRKHHGEEKAKKSGSQKLLGVQTQACTIQPLRMGRYSYSLKTAVGGTKNGNANAMGL